MNRKLTESLEITRSVISAFFLYVLYGALRRSWFIRHQRRPELDGAGIYAHWHGDELLLIGAYVRSQMAVLVSRSRDGQILGYLLKWFGFKVIRGSSSKGGVGGLKGLIDAVQNGGFSASLAVDGPRGPVYRAKLGVIKLAQVTGRPLVPGASSASFRYVFHKAWNRCYLPLPFSKGVIVYGKPLYIPKGIPEEDLEEYRLKLEKELVRLKGEAEAVYDRYFITAPIPVGNS